MLYLYIAGFIQFGLILLGALVTMNVAWAEKYKLRTLAAFAILGLIGFGTTIKIGLDTDSSNEKLAKSLEKLSAITLEMARIQTLNDSLLQGSLSPANDLTPSHRCGVIKDNDLLLFLGSNTVLVDRFPFTVVEAEGYEGIILNKDKNGTIAV